MIRGRNTSMECSRPRQEWSRVLCFAATVIKAPMLFMRRRKGPVDSEAGCREIIATTARHFRLPLDQGEIDDKAARVWRTASAGGRDAIIAAIKAELHSMEQQP